MEESETHQSFFKEHPALKKIAGLVMIPAGILFTMRYGENLQDGSTGTNLQAIIGVGTAAIGTVILFTPNKDR
jgi:drug/metabolite transporter (DMT)-like permease